MDKFIRGLDNFITEHRYVNLHSKGFEPGEKTQKDLELLRSKLSEECGSFFIDIDVKAFSECETEEEEAAVILKLLNDAIAKEQSLAPIPGAISVTDALVKLSERLDQRTLAVFHCFCDIYNEKENNLFRAFRKFIEIFEKSRYLGLLIISDQPTHHWELYPESKLDDRHVAYKEYPG